MPSRERILTLGLKDPERQEAPGWLKRSRALGHGLVRRLTRQWEDGGIPMPREPPQCPAGWTTGPPDFVGVGAQRCGTTRWFDLIASHPEVIPPLSTKELHYFDRFYLEQPTAAAVAGYHEHFPRDGSRKVGEWTPCYMSSPWVPSLLATAAPDVRLLVLVRDPIDRYVSGLQHDGGLAREQGQPLSQHAPLEAYLRGLYYEQIENLLAHFDRSQILLLQYERCTREPLSELRRTFEFLGLRDVAFAPRLDAHPHLQPKKPTLEAKTRAAYVRAYREDVLRLARAFPEIDLSLWRNFAHLESAVEPVGGRA